MRNVRHRPEEEEDDAFESFSSESVDVVSAGGFLELWHRLSPAVRRWVVPSVLALVAAAIGGFWALRTGDSPAPRGAISEQRPDSAPPVLRSFPVLDRVPPPPSLIVQALPRAEVRPRATVSLPENTVRHVPAEPIADRTLSTATPPPAVSPTTNVPDGITVTEVAPAPRPAPELLEPETPAAVVNRAVVTTDRVAVRRTLQEYEDAFEDLDVTAAAVVWPSVDRRALGRAFATLKSQGLHFEECDITVVESNATASCHGTVEFVRRVGRPEPLMSHQRWIFKMRKFGTDWMIEQVTASPLSATGSRVRGAS